jgi:hypothetical protein
MPLPFSGFPNGEKWIGSFTENRDLVAERFTEKPKMGDFWQRHFG